MKALTGIFNICVLSLAITSEAHSVLFTSIHDSIYMIDESTGAIAGNVQNPPDQTERKVYGGLAMGFDNYLYAWRRGELVGNDGQILRFDSETGAFVDEFIAPGTAGYNGGGNITFSQSGDLLAVDSKGIYQFDGQTGAFERILGSGSADDWVGLFDIAIGPNGDIYGSDPSGNKVFRYDGADGSYLGDFVTPQLAGLIKPTGLAFGPDENLYVASEGTTSIFRYDGQTGAFIDVFASGYGIRSPNDINFGPDGNLYVVDSTSGGNGDGQILRFNGQSGEFIDVFTENLFTEPGFLEFASPVPVPAAAWLFGSGLIGLIGVARRKKA